VLALLRNLEGRAVVIVTHEPDAAAIADRILHLSDGKLVDESALAPPRAIGEAGPAPPIRTSRG
jgi:ABC-type transport system involved in cytochrome bd biosynthesis fused ATPase/permease subunit